MISLFDEYKIINVLACVVILGIFASTLVVYIDINPIISIGLFSINAFSLLLINLFLGPFN